MKKRRNIIPAVPGIVLALVASVATVSVVAKEPVPVKLLVGIVVDGLDADKLDLLRDHFGQDGFRRLEKGAVITGADYGSYLDPAAATATLMTGAAPSVSGIGAAEIYNCETLRAIPIYADAAHLGNFTSQTYSPSALKVTTISDEARIAAGGVNVVYAIAPDAARALALGGHAGNAAIWLDSKTGNWASSTFYKEMPVAVATRNRTNPLSMRMDTMSWTPSHSFADYPSLPEHLRKYPFRYVFPRANTNRLDMFVNSPLVNREISNVAIDLIQSLRIGKHDDGVDVLNIAYNLRPYAYGKSTDTRPEEFDAYVKLDQNLEQLFSAIDRNVGLDHTLIFLAGTPPEPTGKRDDEKWSIPYGEFSSRKAVSLLNMYLMAVYGNGEYVAAYHNGRFFLNLKLIKERKLDIKAVRADAAAFLAKMQGVDRVYTQEDILAGRAGNRPEALRRNTVVAHAGDLLITVAPGYELIDDFNNPASQQQHLVYRTAATTAPAFIIAPEIAPQVIGTPVDVRTLAPTVARILRIRSPNGASETALTLQKK